MDIAHSRLRIVSRVAVPVVLFILAAGVLLRFPPTEFGFYPRCPIYQYLHLQCPGCGATRALAALLRGHLVDALRLNALTTLALPFATAYAAICYHRSLRGETFRWPKLPSASIYVALAVAVVFTIARNLHSL
jgi:hypothetical protein